MMVIFSMENFTEQGVINGLMDKIIKVNFLKAINMGLVFGNQIK